ncbi:MAG: type I 3-dehydroquinate dehydratase [Verrucomicrobiae bacterium]|nr:type I 3-dehydroquinate dehydratase [Verrucomicrobiae bacterium]
MARKIPWRKKWLRVGVISAPTGLSYLQQSSLPCELVEIRLDYFSLTLSQIDQLKKQLRTRKHPVLLTLRSPREGGQKKLTPKQRETLLFDFLPFIDALDLEYLEIHHFSKLLKKLKREKVALILSSHFFQKTPTFSQLKNQFHKMQKESAAIYKVAARCDTTPQLFTLLQTQLQFANKSVACMGMGKLAHLSRQLLPLLGAKLVYGYLDSPTAPGQPAVKTFKPAH